MLYLCTLGHLSLHDGEPSSPALLSESKSLVIVALLAVAPEHRMRREHMAELLWPGKDHENVRRSLRQALYYLSKHTDQRLVDDDDGHLCLGNSFDCDLWQLDRAIQAGRHEEVVEKYSGRFLERMERKLGQEVREWIDSQNRRISAARRDAFRELIRAAFDRNDHARAVSWAEKIAASEPLNDQAQLALIQTLKAARDDAAAMRAYESYRALLRSAVDDLPPKEVEEAIAGVRQALLEKDSWRPIARPLPKPLTQQTARRYAGVIFAAGALLGGGGLVLGLRAMAGSTPDSVPNASVHNLRGSLYLRLQEDPTAVWRLALEGSGAQLLPTDYEAEWVPSPNLRRFASIQQNPGGYDLVLGDAESGRSQLLLTGKADELPLGWSPDGRQLLVSMGSVADGDTAYHERLAVYDLATGDVRELAKRANRTAPASWSPDGTRIAFLTTKASPADLVVVNADGRNPVTLLSQENLHGQPLSWSPDGHYLSFVSTRSGDAQIFVIPREGGDPLRITHEAGNRRDAIWLSEAVLAFVWSRGGESDVWVVDRFSGETRRLTEISQVDNIFNQFPTGSEGSWIETLTIDVPATLAEGETVVLAVRASDNRGAAITSDGLPVRWFVSNSTVAEVIPVSREGQPSSQQVLALRALQPGSTELIASLADWRVDTLRVTVLPLFEDSLLKPVLDEMWSDGIRPDRWRSVGDPLPYTRPAGGPAQGGVFVNNGDQNHVSGVTSVRSFSLAEGLTIEAWGRMPFTGRHFEDYQIWVLGQLPDPNVVETFDLPILALMINGQASQATFQGPRQIALPFPETPAEWHRYALQIEPDGTVSILVDGLMIRRERAYLKGTELPGRVYVGLGGNSRGDVEIQHGLVRVWEGVRYKLGSLAEPNR